RPGPAHRAGRHRAGGQLRLPGPGVRRPHLRRCTGRRAQSHQRPGHRPHCGRSHHHVHHRAGRNAPMNLTYTGIELRRVGRDYISMFFVAVLPAFMYIVFGAAMSWSDAPVGNGNAAMYTMISMAAFGAVTATVGVGGMAAVERMQGWGRQLGLTPMSDAQYVAVKAGVAFVIALIPITLIYVLGYFTGSQGSGTAWLISALVVVLGAAVFSLYGLLAGLLFRSEAAVGAASGSLV